MVSSFFLQPLITRRRKKKKNGLVKFWSSLSLSRKNEGKPSRGQKLREDVVRSEPSSRLERTRKNRIDRKHRAQVKTFLTLRQSSFKINFPSMGLPPTKIEAVILKTNSNVSLAERETRKFSLIFSWRTVLYNALQTKICSRANTRVTESEFGGGVGWFPPLVVAVNKNKRSREEWRFFRREPSV